MKSQDICWNCIFMMFFVLKLQICNHHDTMNQKGGKCYEPAWNAE